MLLLLLTIPQLSAELEEVRAEGSQEKRQRQRYERQVKELEEEIQLIRGRYRKVSTSAQETELQKNIDK